MNKRIAIFSALAMLATATSYVQDARSDTLPGIAGRAWIPGEQSCFNSGWASVTNTCDPVRKLLIPATMRWTGTTVYRASDDQNTSSIWDRPSCRAIVNTANNAFVSQTSTVTLFGLTTLGTLSTPSNASHHFDCDLVGNNGPNTQNGLSYVAWSTN